MLTFTILSISRIERFFLNWTSRAKRFSFNVEQSSRVEIKNIH